MGFADLLRPGGRLLAGQGAAEPVAALRALFREPPSFQLPLFLGPGWSDLLAEPLPEVFQAESYGAIGRLSALARAGRLSVLPMHFSALNREMGGPALPVDTVLLQLRPALSGRGWNLGLTRDFVLSTLPRARQVLIEVNESLPACEGGDIGEIPGHVVLQSDLPPVVLPPARPSEVEERVARNVAALIPDGAVLQLGVGSLPAAVLAALRGHRDLGLHSGLLPEGVADLIEAGVLTNARKTVNAGVSVTGNIAGTERLYALVHRNRAVRLAGPEETHDFATLAAIPRFHAINSALEVDLTGQTGSEEVGGRVLGAIGGQVDFSRGAMASPGGRAILALPSVTPKGDSRIVPRVSVVSCARSDVDLVVTEQGVADLRGQPPEERVRRMIAIAAPEHREALSRDWRDRGGRL